MGYAYEYGIRSVCLSGGSGGDAGFDNVRLTEGFILGSYLTADLNDDYYVNIYDLRIFALRWLECSRPENPNCTELP